MFANIARFPVAGVLQAAPRSAPLAHSNDNSRMVHAGAGLRRRGRPILACHWRPIIGGGRLECYWDVELTESPASEEPDPRFIRACATSGFARAA
jgi:hypothetical protein